MRWCSNRADSWSSNAPGGATSVAVVADGLVVNMGTPFRCRTGAGGISPRCVSEGTVRPGINPEQINSEQINPGQINPGQTDRHIKFINRRNPPFWGVGPALLWGLAVISTVLPLMVPLGTRSGSRRRARRLRHQ